MNKEEMDAKIKEMTSAICAIRGCDKKQMMWITLLSPVNDGTSIGFPFCEDHVLKVQLGEGDIILKNGWVYKARGR